ncbi:MAG: hypothetical protein IPQ04_14540 [Saprospiraceae bacterium]|nr:hypothetical protein [Saprospiraceae bacterium]
MPNVPIVSACNGAEARNQPMPQQRTLPSVGGTLTDACSTIAMSSSDVTAASGCNETLTRTYLFTDACNNTVTCDQIIVRKIDLTAPTAKGMPNGTSSKCMQWSMASSLCYSSGLHLKQEEPRRMLVQR